MIDKEIVFEDPPPSGRTRYETRRFVEVLRSRPGEWARYPTVLGKGSALGGYRRRYPEVEWVGRNRPDGTCDVWARWVGDGS